MKGFISAFTAIFLGQTLTPQANGPTKPAVTLSAEEVVKELQKFYDNSNDFQADFQQIYTYKAYGRTQKSKGRVYLKKAGKMRWHYKSNPQKFFIADGKDLWVYEPEEAQAYQQAMEESQLPVVVTFLFGKGKLLDEFNAKLLSADPRAKNASDYVIELTPKTEAEYKQVVMVVSSKFLLKEVFVYDTVGNENHLIFSKASVNKGIDDSQFTFTPPPGVKVITASDVKP